MRYEWKRKPYAHQVKGVRKLLSTGRGGALLMEPRTGKTKTTIDYLSFLARADKIDRAVIIAPARVLDVWVDELHANCPVKYHVHIWDADARASKAIPPVREGRYDLNILLVNYEAFSVPGKKTKSGKESKASGRFKNRALIRKWLDRHTAACVLDESHKIKSASGKAATMIVSMQPMFQYRVILTGTPVTKAKRIFDIYMQWLFLNPDRFSDVPTVSDFKNRYGQWTNANGFPQFLRAANLPELRKRIHADAFEVKREDCYDLPPSTTRLQRVILDTHTATVYDELAEEYVAILEHDDEEVEVDAPIELVLAMRLSQVTSGFARTSAVVNEEGEVEKPAVTIPLGTSKLDALRTILEEHIENDEPVVVCARWKYDLDSIERLCETLFIPHYSIRGGLSRNRVSDNIRQFSKSAGVAVAIMQPDAGALGIDLSRASHMVWYSLPLSWVNYSQSCDRIALSDKPTTYTYLLVPRTVDRLIYDMLQTDGDVAKTIARNPRKVLRK